MNKRTRYGVAVVSLLVIVSLLAVGCERGGELQTMGTSHITSDVEFGVDGTGVDVTWYSGTSGDNMLWDASAEALVITGSNGQDGLQVADGDLDVVDNVDIEGNVDINGTTNLDAVDIDGAVNFADTLTLAKGSGNALVISSGGDADVNGKIDLDGHADEVQLAVTGYTTQTNDLVQLDGGLVDIGGGTYEQVDGDNDLGIAGDLEAEGTTDLASLELAGTAVTASAGEINETAGLVGGATIAVGTEDTNEVTATIQLEDADGNDISAITGVLAYISDDSGGDGVCATAPDGTMAAGTDGYVIELVTGKVFWLFSESDGDIDVTMTESGADTFYLIVVLGNGQIVASGAFSFTGG